jgi:ribosomal protein L7/L12
MDYYYNTTTAVPESVIRHICTDMLRKTLSALEDANPLETEELTDIQLYEIGRRMNHVMNKMCKDNHVSVDGWHLTDSQIAEIFHALKDYKKIQAIKEFRAATNTGLVDAKEFIERFCHGTRKEAGPLAGIAFKAAFGK